MEAALKERDRVGVQDFVLLEDYESEDAFIENLRKRFQTNLIYTYIGNVLVSVNPYHNTDIYTPAVIDQYKGRNFYELPPHLYAIADTSYRYLRNERKDQCILISGESGSGKTEATKKILHYIAAVSLSTENREMERVKERLLQSNPVLEAFGNAKTIRNDNSSRFGKYMDIQFDFKGAPVGGHILNYLLEKSRVIHQGIGERNFHIFYQLIAGIDQDCLIEFQLCRDPERYFYLNQSGCIKVQSIEDKTDFDIVNRALSVIDFTNEEIHNLYSLVASILHLGNVGFTEVEGVAKVIETNKNIQIVSKLLDCSVDSLRQAFTHRTIFAAQEKFVTPLNRDQGVYARDALAKAMYSRMFAWLVTRINKSLSNEELKQNSVVMGLLDIYGFEIFNINGFEQFCINYCNEKLQQLFIELTLKQEQEEYHREGIKWVPVEYFNNKIICDLIEEKHKGVISILDEECLMPGEATDTTFLSKLDTAINNHPHFITHNNAGYESRRTIHRLEFRLVHYAGEVTYSINGFLDKNNDLLYRDLKEVMIESKNMITSTVFTRNELNDKKRPETAATQFKNSLSELMEILMLKNPSYVRCIKPNHSKMPAQFSDTIVRHQVKYLGLLENLRVRRAGFAYRRKHDVFLERYKCLCSETWPHYNGPVQEGVLTLCKSLNYETDDYEIGKTQLFIRFPRTLFATEDAYQLKKNDLATKIQAEFRAFCQRRIFLRMKRAATVIACHWKSYKARMLKIVRKNAAMTITRFIKGFLRRFDEYSDLNSFYFCMVRISMLMNIINNCPENVLDKSWPTPPQSLKEASDELHEICTMNIVRKYCKSISPEQKNQLQIKLEASDLFKGRKVSYPASVVQPFVDNRLPAHMVAMKNAIFENNIKHGEERVQYASPVLKYHRSSYKPISRVLIITNEAIYLLDERTFNMKYRFPLEAVTGISVSANADTVFIVHVKTDNKKDKGDLILSSEYLFEVLMKLVKATNSNNIVKIVDSQTMKFSLVTGKQCSIVFKSDHKTKEMSVKRSKKNEMVVVSPQDAGGNK